MPADGCALATRRPPAASIARTHRPLRTGARDGTAHEQRPVIGLTLDAEEPGGYSKLPWYALRQNYFAVLAEAGALPIALPHHAELAGEYLDRVDGLLVTGGAFDVDPSLYGGGPPHPTVTLKPAAPISSWRRRARRWRATCRCSASAAGSNCWRWPSAAR